MILDEAHALVEAAERRVGDHYRERLIQHLAERLDRDLREGLPARPPSSEEAAMAMIQTIATELKQAAEALDVAAERLREAGEGRAAGAAKHASRQAHLAHAGLVGEPRV